VENYEFEYPLPEGDDDYWLSPNHEDHLLPHDPEEPTHQAPL